MKTITKYFEQDLIAPFKNSQWSWGSENEFGVYLKVWEEDIIEQKTFLCKKKSSSSRLGYFERLRQIKTIQQGKPGYVVVLKMKSGKNERIESYSKYLYPIKSICLDNDDGFFAYVDYNQPLLPIDIKKTINLNLIFDAVSSNPLAKDCFIRATEEFGWRPTKLVDSMIFLISRDGKQQAKIDIDTGEYKRF
ncbi:hypothetical protein [Vibrio rotiferianus]|uniref:hypothetical protein n=1 Tax=Vibrio rotiferianus TaxID=190895 RepID=UPI00406A407A